MHFPVLLQNFLDYLTNAEQTIRRDRLFPRPHKYTELFLLRVQFTCTEYWWMIFSTHMIAATFIHIYCNLSYQLYDKLAINQQFDTHIIPLTRV